MKKTKRLILIGLAVIVLLALGLYAAVKITLPPAKIREIIHVQGSKVVGRSVDVGSIDVRLIPLKVVVNEINVANAPGFSMEPAIKLREVHLSLSLLSLLRFAPVINQIKLVSPEILYEVGADGHNNLEGLGGKADTAAAPAGPVELPVALALKSFVIVEGKVRYRDAKTGRELSLGGIHQDMSIELDPKLERVHSSGILEIAKLAFEDRTSGLSKGDLHIAVRHDLNMNLPQQLLTLNKIELTFQDIHAEMSGSISRFRTEVPEADIRVSAPSISLASVLKEVPATLSPEISKLKAAGTASFSAHLRGKLDSASKPDVEAELQVHGASLSHSEVPLPIEHLEVDLAIRHDSLRLAKLDLDMGPHPVRVAALVSSLREKIPYLENLSVDASLDLGALAALAQRMGLLDKSMSLSGMETVKLKASGPLDATNPQKISATGDVQIQSVKVNLPGKPPVALDGKITIDNEKLVETLALRVGKSDLDLNAEISNYIAMVLPEQKGRAHAKIGVRSNLIELDELLPPPSTTTAKADSGQPLRVYPELPPIDADVSINLGRTRLMGLEMTQFQSQTSVRAKEIKTDLKGGLYNGAITSTLTLIPKSPTDMGVAFKSIVSRVEANDFISRLNDRVPLKNRLFKSLAGTDSVLFGKINLNADLATQGLPDQFADNLTGTVKMEVVDGKIMESSLTKSLSGALASVSSALGFRQLTFGDMKGDFAVEQGNLLVKDFRIESSPVGSLQAAGKVGFDNALDMQLTQALPPGVSKLVGGASSTLTGQLAKLASVPAANVSLVPMDKSGHALLYFLVKGTVTQPAFSLDAPRMAREGAGSAKAALADALKQKENELKARAEAEKQKLEAEARARAEAEKKKAVNEVKKQGKKVLKNLGF